MPSKSYQASEADTTWSDAGTTSDKLMDAGALAANGGVVCGAYLDLGVAPRSDIYEAELFIDGFDTAPVVGEMVELWFTQSDDATDFDGRPTTAPTASAEGTITVDQAMNCTNAVSVRVASTTAGDDLQRRRTIRLTGRYVAPVLINRTADILLSTSDAHMVTLTPIPQESQ